MANGETKESEAAERWTCDPVTADKRVSAGPSLLGGIVIDASAADGDITIYDGRDAGTGKKLGTFKGIAAGSTPIPLGKPVYCERGIYVDVGTNVTEAQIIWRALSEREAVQRPAPSAG